MCVVCGSGKRGSIVHMMMLRICICDCETASLCGWRGHFSMGNWTLSQVIWPPITYSDRQQIVNGANFSDVCALLSPEFGLMISTCLAGLPMFQQTISTMGHSFLHHI